MTTNFGRSRTGNCTTSNFAHQGRKGVKKIHSLINFDHNFWGFEGSLTESWPRWWEIVMREVHWCWLMKQLVTFWVAPLLFTGPACMTNLNYWCPWKSGCFQWISQIEYHKALILSMMIWRMPCSLRRWSTRLIICHLWWWCGCGWWWCHNCE